MTRAFFHFLNSQLSTLNSQLTLALCLSAALVTSTTAAAAAQPNILWITCEDMSPDLPVYGDHTAHTPNLERFAYSGMRYERAFATSPVCSPSRSTIITGVYATTLGTHQHRSKVELPAGIKTFPALLREAGYYCTNNVKTDYNFPVPDGMWDENSKAAHWRNRPNPEQPFFSVFNLTTTHESKMHLPDDKFEEVVKDVKPEHRVDPAKVPLPPYIPDTPVVRKDWARYYDTISQMDFEFGQILNQLVQDGLTTNTVVCFFSDHGRGMPRGKRWLYDSGLRVPLIIRWPGVTDPDKARNLEMVSLIDMAPTVLAIAGVPAPPYMSGRIIVGPQAEVDPGQIFATRDRMDEVHDMSRAVRGKRHLYIRNFYPERPYSTPIQYMDKNPTMKEWRRLNAEGKLTGPQALFFQPAKPAEELYDVMADPHQIHNLADDPAQAKKLKEMREMLDRWQKTTKDRGFEPEQNLEEPGQDRKEKKKRRAARRDKTTTQSAPADE